MKAKWMITFLWISVLIIVFHQGAVAQCSLCTKTAQQLGSKAASGLNTGILYLMSTPLLIAGVIGYRWWRSNQGEEDNNGDISNQ